jgi:hypothetical protein
MLDAETIDGSDDEIEIDWDESIRLQVSELLCEFYEACESGEIDAPEHNRLRGIYPTIAYDEETCSHPVLLAINIPMLRGGAINYQYDWHELPLPLNQLLTEIQENEGLPLEHAGKAFSPQDLLYEARLALTVTQDDVEFAKEHGWPELMQRVREGTRSTNRLAAKCLGRYIKATKRVQRRQRREAKKQRDSDQENQEGGN